VFSDHSTASTGNAPTLRRSVLDGGASMARALGVPPRPADAADAADAAAAAAAAASAVRCALIGPFGDDDAPAVLRMYDLADVFPVHDEPRLWSSADHPGGPADPDPNHPADPARLIGFAVTRTADALAALQRAAAAARVPIDVAPPANDDGEPDVVLALDSIDFADMALRQLGYASASFDERAAMRPSKTSTRFNGLEAVWARTRGAGQLTDAATDAATPPYTWEALALASVGRGRRRLRWTVGVERALRWTVGVERALQGRGGVPTLYVGHKATDDLARQLFDAAMWLGAGDCAERRAADRLLLQAAHVGFYVRAITAARPSRPTRPARPARPARQATGAEEEAAWGSTAPAANTSTPQTTGSPPRQTPRR